jgi:hypothetical protein
MEAQHERSQLSDLQGKLAAKPMAPPFTRKLPPPLPSLPPRMSGVGMLLEAHEGQEKVWARKLVPGLPAQLGGQIQIHDFAVQGL